jgi:hypothetical protein
MDSHTRIARKARLEIEALEDRVTPQATTYVTGLYNDVLHRPPDPQGLNFWVGQLQAGSSVQEVASAFWLSPEHRTLQVEQYYEQYLHRPADPAGLDFWTRVFTNGGQSEIQVQEGIIASQEFQTANSSNTAYVTALYLDILGRPPDPAGLAFWQGQLQSGASRQQVALGILSSDEARLRLLDSYYLTLLHRPPDTPGEQFWLNRLRDNDPEDRRGREQGGDLNDNNNHLRDLREFVEHVNDNDFASQESVAVDFLTSQEYRSTHGF